MNLITVIQATEITEKKLPDFASSRIKIYLRKMFYSQLMGGANIFSNYLFLLCALCVLCVLGGRPGI